MQAKTEAYLRDLQLGESEGRARLERDEPRGDETTAITREEEEARDRPLLARIWLRMQCVIVGRHLTPKCEADNAYWRHCLRCGKLLRPRDW